MSDKFFFDASCVARFNFVCSADWCVQLGELQIGVWRVLWHIMGLCACLWYFTVDGFLFFAFAHVFFCVWAFGKSIYVSVLVSRSSCLSIYDDMCSICVELLSADLKFTCFCFFLVLIFVRVWWVQNFSLWYLLPSFYRLLLLSYPFFVVEVCRYLFNAAVCSFFGSCCVHGNMLAMPFWSWLSLCFFDSLFHFTMASSMFWLFLKSVWRKLCFF